MFVWFTLPYIVKKTRFKRKRCSEIWLRTKIFWANFVGKRREKKRRRRKRKIFFLNGDTSKRVNERERE